MILKQQQNMRPYRLCFVQSGWVNKNINTKCLNVNVMLSNMTFLMIFAVFDQSPLTLWINCSF